MCLVGRRVVLISWIQHTLSSLRAALLCVFCDYEWFITLYLQPFVRSLVNSWHRMSTWFFHIERIQFNNVGAAVCQIATFECGHAIRETLCNAGNWCCWQVCRRTKAGHNKKMKMISAVDKWKQRRCANQFVRANCPKSLSWNLQRAVIRIKKNTSRLCKSTNTTHHGPVIK